jgi:hypothetical protein
VTAVFENWKSNYVSYIPSSLDVAATCTLINLSITGLGHGLLYQISEGHGAVI